jgi:hypothetical protein
VVWLVALLSPEATASTNIGAPTKLIRASLRNKAAGIDVFTHFRNFRYLYSRILASSAPAWTPHVSVLRTRFSTDQVLQPIIDRCGSPPVVVGGQCNQPLASDISHVVSLVSLRRAQTGPCPLLPCQNSSQNNLSLRIFSRVPHAMSSPAYFRAKHCLHTVTCSDELG